MTASAFDRIEVKVVRLPVWAAPLAAAVGIALVGLAGVLGFGLLLLLSPIMLVAAVAQFFKRRRSREPADRSDRNWPRPQKPAQPAQPLVIEAEYEVIDNESQTPAPKTSTGDK